MLHAACSYTDHMIVQPAISPPTPCSIMTCHAGLWLEVLEELLTILSVPHHILTCTPHVNPSLLSNRSELQRVTAAISLGMTDDLNVLPKCSVYMCTCVNMCWADMYAVFVELCHSNSQRHLRLCQRLCTACMSEM